MKDYSETKEEKKQFILNYRIKEGKIIVNSANGEKYILPHTPENISKLDEKMQQQSSIKNLKQAANTFYIKYKKLLYVAYILGMATLLSLIISLIGTVSYFAISISSMFAIATIIVGLIANDNNQIYKDAQKHILFKNNEEEFTKNKTNNELKLSKTNENYDSYNENKICLNNLDKYSLKDLQKILITINDNNQIDDKETIKVKTKIKK